MNKISFEMIKQRYNFAGYTMGVLIKYGSRMPEENRLGLRDEMFGIISDLPIKKYRHY